jgi:protocatechuate 3,4-dioxygenase beta subunit
MTVETTPQTKLLENVLESFKNTPTPRLQEIVTSMLKHMHAFVDEVDLTQDEWMAGIQFLTAVGKFSTDARQEMILLSDVLGVSSLVEMINYKGMSGATENTVLGPFYIPNSKIRKNGESVIETEDPGQRLRVSGNVRSQDGKPIQGATLEIWETATNGFYPVQDPKQDPMNLRGTLISDENGYFEFLTVRPVPYPVPVDGPVGDFMRGTGRHPMRAAHIHFVVKAAGHYPVQTHVFDSESDYLDSDAVFGVRDSLILKFVEQPDGMLKTTFDIMLTPVE